MAMRLDLFFKTPLSSEQRNDFTLEVACLAKSRQVRWLDGGFRAVVMGEAMGRERISGVVEELQLPIERIESSLSDAEDELADDVPGAGKGQERFRPMGR